VFKYIGFIGCVLNSVL